MNINLLEMSDSWLEDLDVRKPHGNIIREGDPEMAVTLGGFQDFVAGRLVETDSGAWPTRSLAAASSIAGSTARSLGRAGVIVYTGHLARSFTVIGCP